jgi:tetratricopeptide (TPR) repeat protein
MTMFFATLFAAAAAEPARETVAAPAPVVAPRELSAAEVFAAADALVAQGRLADAEILLTGLTHDPSLDYRSEARFRLGRLRAAQSDLAGAIRWYRALLDEKPDAAAVRLELARTYALANDEEAARRELRRVGAAGLPEDVARVVDQFALALRSRRLLGGSIEVDLAPDSNINRASSSGQIDTVLGPLTPDADARATSGVGLTLRAQGFWRSGNGPTSMLARLTGQGDLYRKSRFDDVALSAAIGPELRRGDARWRPALLYVRRWFGGHPYSQAMGGTLNWLRVLTPASQIEVEATSAYTYYRFRVQDGMLYDLNVNYDRALSERFSVRASARATRADARDPGYATWSGTLGGLAARRLGRQTGFVQASATRLAADNRLNLFPQTRQDWRLDMVAGLLLDQWRFADLSPVLRLRYSVARSTVDLYRFRQLRLEFGLSREF